MATRTKTFPGVYTQIVDQSFITPTRSRFQLGILGVAAKGPFNVPTAIATLGQFVQTFGKPIPDSATRQMAFFLSDAVAMVADMTDAITVVRVGNTYADLPVSTDVSGHAGTYVIATGTDNANFVQALLTEGQEVYLSISEGGKFSTVNVQVLSVDSITGMNINLVSIGTPTPDSLAANYLDATVQYSTFSGAAWQAEGLLYAYSYGSLTSDMDDPLTAVGNVTGIKNDFQFQVAGDPSGIAVGNLYKIAHASPTDGPTTHEVRVSRVVPNILALGATVYLETADITRVGYQALPLQDSYTTGVLYQANTATSVKIPFMWLRAKTAGDWANGTSSKTGLYVRVRPGSDPGTKKLEVFWDSALVETLDNISDTADATDANSYETVIGNSQYIEFAFRYSAGGGQVYHAANTAAPWDSTYYDPQLNPLTPPISMPFGSINAGIVSNTDRGGQFVGGFNGENAQPADIIGTYDPTADAGTGIKAFEDTDNVQINVLACPMDSIPIEVMQELRRVAKKVNALAIVDVPRYISARQAIDWHNGQGQYTGRGRIDDPNIAVYWNWFQITDPFTGLVKWVPPTLGTIRCMAFTFDRDKPWYAAAGENRGIIPEALAVEFPRVPEDVRQAMYGNGNSVNPILRLRGRFLLYGERTLQRAESKLTAVHSVILVNWVVTGLAEIGRRFVFDPNDLELLVQIRLAFSEYLDKIRNERGIEEYELVVDDRNNSADTRNRREVIVDLAIVPTDVAERIYINATVRESGAQLNSIQ